MSPMWANNNQEEIDIVVRNIEWDTDGDKEVFDSLPQEVILPDYLIPSNYESEDEYLDEVGNWLIKEYEFCHKKFGMPTEE